MPTIQEKMTTQLVAHGLWADEADKVIERYKASDMAKEMERRWDDDVEGYQPMIFAVLWIGLKSEAIKFLEETKPMHFALHLLRDDG